MEQQKSEERENVIFLAVLNDEIGKTLVSWRDGPVFLKDAVKLTTLIQLAEKAGKGYTVEISQNAILAGQIDGLTDEAKKYIEPGMRDSLVFTLPGAAERKTSHRRVLRIKISENYLFLESSKGTEARFKREDVLSLEARYY